MSLEKYCINVKPFYSYLKFPCAALIIPAYLQPHIMPQLGWAAVENQWAGGPMGRSPPGAGTGLLLWLEMHDRWWGQTAGAGGVGDPVVCVQGGGEWGREV